MKTPPPIGGRMTERFRKSNMAKEPETTSSQALRLYRDLADW